MGNTDHEPAGVGGWLGLLVFVLLIVGPVAAVGGTAIEIIDTEKLYPQLTSSAIWHDAKVIAWGFAVLQAMVLGFAGWRLAYRRVPRSVHIAVWALWIGGPLLNGLSLVTIALAMDAIDELVAAPGPFYSMLPALIWTVYLTQSRRVKNTYYSADVESDDTTARPVTALRRELSYAQRRTIFFTTAWVVVILIFALLFDARYDGIFSSGSRRDWPKIAIWALVPPFLFIVGRWAYRRFVTVSSEEIA